VIVEKKGGCFSGCSTTLAILVLIGLAIEYWYVALGIAALVVVAGAIVNAQKRQQARYRPAPQDPWVNEVTVALADLGLIEQARNTGAQLGGVPLGGDIGLQDKTFVVFVKVFATNELARQAETGLRANAKIHNAILRGRTAVRSDGRVLYVANGRGHAVDDFRLDDVVRLVGPINVPSPDPPSPSRHDHRPEPRTPRPASRTSGRSRPTRSNSSPSSASSTAPTSSPMPSSNPRRQTCFAGYDH
jgi:hypothetical protein